MSYYLFKKYLGNLHSQEEQKPVSCQLDLSSIGIIFDQVTLRLDKSLLKVRSRGGLT